MATYKLIQDIEAEDKILGPLTLKQFIFAIIAVFFGYLCFLVTSKGAPFLLVVFLPPLLFFGFFALPLGRDQPTEVWALAKLRFLFKPRKRIWNQSGVKELVTITVPKKIERHLTKGYSQTEVDSRLHALADTIDSRGWAVKHVNLNAYAAPQYRPPASDRLLDPATLPQVAPKIDVAAEDDMMDINHSPIAQQFQSMIDESAAGQRQAVVNRMDNTTPGQALTPAPSDNYWFMDNSAKTASSTDDDATSAPVSNQDNKPKPYSNMRSAKTTSKKSKKSEQITLPPPMTAPTDPAILSLAENDDLNVSTLAREAKRAKGEDDSSGDEVVVSLH